MNTKLLLKSVLIGFYSIAIVAANISIASPDQQAACAFLNPQFTFKIEPGLAIAEATSRDCIFNHVLLVGTTQTTDSSGISTSQWAVQHVGKLQSIKLLEGSDNKDPLANNGQLQVVFSNKQKKYTITLPFLTGKTDHVIPTEEIAELKKYLKSPSSSKDQLGLVVEQLTINGNSPSNILWFDAILRVKNKDGRYRDLDLGPTVFQPTMFEDNISQLPKSYLKVASFKDLAANKK